MNKSLILSLLPLLALTSCNKIDFVSSKPFCFNTMVEIKLYQGDKENIKDIELILNRYDLLSDNYQRRNENNIWSINQTNDDISIDKNLYELLKVSFDVIDKGATYFNPLCGSLSKKWKESLNNKEVLSNETINEELEKMRVSSLIFKENNIVLRVGESEIDLGGIAKGYVLDKIKDYLEEKNINEYIINAGMSSILLGEKNTKDGFFNIEFKDIKGSYIKLKNTFISTSGNSTQGVTINGVKYSHVINPYTGSAINNYDAVMVIADKGYYSDAMSTSLLMNSVEEIKEIENEYDIKCIAIKDQKIVYKNNEIEVFH